LTTVSTFIDYGQLDTGKKEEEIRANVWSGGSTNRTFTHDNSKVDI